MNYLQWGINYPALAISSFLSATLLPGSAEVIFTAMVTQGYAPLPLIGVASVFNTLGSVVTYYMGRLGKEAWLSRYFGIKPRTVKRLEKYIQRYEAFLAFWAWLPWIGDAIPAALGFFRAPIGPAILWMWAGKTVRFIALWLAVKGIIAWW